jgi:uncharacterized membrane protein
VRFEQAMEGIVLLFEAAGVAVLVGGSLTAGLKALLRYVRGERAGVYEAARQGIGRAILLGLEILIIADIIQTIIVDPTLESAATLGIIVLVRIILSFSLDIELTGRLPWRIADAAAEETTGPTQVPSPD